MWSCAVQPWWLPLVMGDCDGVSLIFIRIYKFKTTSSWKRSLSHWPLQYISNFKSVVCKHILPVKIMSTSYELALSWISQNTFDYKSTLLQVMAWCHQATSHNLSQRWPRSWVNMPYGITEQNGWHFADDIFKYIIFNETVQILIKDSDNEPSLVQAILLPNRL